MKKETTPAPSGTNGKKQTPENAEDAQSQLILLSEISIGGNPRTEFDDPKLQELASSIAVDGVLQNIGVRPMINGKFKYELVYGARRYRASLMAKKTTIPAIVRNYTDEQVMAIQLKENLLREDITALDEAAWFAKFLKSGISVEELGLRIGKKKDYINRRLRLNDMVPDFRKLLHEKKMDLVHAFEIYKLTAADQQKYYDNLEKNKGLDLIQTQTAKQLENDILRNLVQSLKDAPFNINDENLVPAAGSCLNCPKRSGNNTTLFGDGKDDRCYDTACFKNKIEVTFQQKLQLAVENLEVTLIQTNHGGTDKTADKLKQAGQPVLVQHSGKFDECQKSTPGARKAFWVDGSNKGETTYIKLREQKKQAQYAAPKQKETPAVLKAKIQTEKLNGRIQDARAIADKIEERFYNLPEYKNNSKHTGAKLKPAEQQAMMLIVLEKAGEYNFTKDLKVKDDNYSEALAAAKPELLNKITREALKEFIDNNVTADSIEANALRLISTAYFPDDIKKWEEEQQQICKQREALLDAKLKPAEKQPAAKKEISKVKQFVAHRSAGIGTSPKSPVASKSQTSPPVSKKSTAYKFMEKLVPSADLAVIVGKEPLPRTEVTRVVWEYVKKHKLQNQKDRRNINGDAVFTKIVGKNTVSMFEMAKHLNKHLSAIPKKKAAAKKK